MPLHWILLLALCWAAAGAGESGRILLLNSYHRSDWTDAVQRGVEAALAGRPGWDLAVDYLDTKRAQSPEYLAQLAAMHRIRYAGERFRAVIAVDDHAFHYALDHQADLFAGVPVAFCGINEFAPGMTAGRLAAGVSERGDISATLELALRLRPQTRRVLLLCDRTQAGLANRREFEAAMAHDHAGIAVEALDDGDLAGLAGRLARAGPEAIAFFDVTEEAALQERLAHAERLDAIGRLAGGVAHDFNNMLTGVTGAIELIRLQLPAGSELVQWADLALESGRRAADLTHQLMAFSRKHAVRSESVDVDHAIARVVAMLGRTIDRRIGLAHHRATAPARVRGDPAQIESACLNLGLNARDAMPEGGELRYEVDLVEAPPRPGLASTACVRIRVSDSGVGIPAAVLPRIFEPFFTTKGLGRGTGLGLAAVHGTAESHGGSITVASEPGQGSVFTLLLPADLTASAASRTPDPPGQVVGRRHVLIVEDEASLRELLTAQVETLGWSSVSAKDGADALALFAASPDAFDAVLLDLVMPTLGGHEAFVRLRALRPRLPVVVMSGYDPVAGGAERLVGDGAVFLQKPYNGEALATALARAIAATR